MKLDDMKISTRLIAGFSMLSLLIAFMSDTEAVKKEAAHIDVARKRIDEQLKLMAGQITSEEGRAVLAG